MRLEEDTRYPHTPNYWHRFENPPKMRGVLDRTKKGAPELNAINEWHVTEKIDGTNIRVMLRNVHGTWQVDLFTREGTDSNIVWPGAKDYLRRTFTLENIFKAVDIAKLEEDTIVILYGEMFGPKIQGGGTYSSTVQYALFDVKIDDWWLEPERVRDFAVKLGIRYVPVIGMLTTHEVMKWFDLVMDNEQQAPNSYLSDKHIMEGIVCRAHPMMLFRNTRSPIQFKLKFKDMQQTLAWEREQA